MCPVVWDRYPDPSWAQGLDRSEIGDQGVGGDQSCFGGLGEIVVSGSCVSREVVPTYVQDKVSYFVLFCV